MTRRSWTSYRTTRKLPRAQTDKGFEVQLQMDQKTAEVIKQRAVRQAVDTIRNRVDAFGVAEPDVVIQGVDRIVVQLPGLKEDITRAIDIIKKTARLEFKLVDEKGDLNAALKGDIPTGDEILYQQERSRRIRSDQPEAVADKKADSHDR